MKASKKPQANANSNHASAEANQSIQVVKLSAQNAQATAPELEGQVAANAHSLKRAS